MKSLYVLLLVIAVIGVSLGMSVSHTKCEPVYHKPVSHQVVYVDISKLVKLHPSWQAVENMKATAADVKTDSSEIVLPKVNSDFAMNGHSVKAAGNMHSKVSRRALEMEVCKSAASALQQLESDQWEALQTRLRAKRSTMLQSAQAEIKLQRNEIRVDSAEKMKSAATAHSMDLLNAQMKVNALRSASKVLGVGASLKPKLDAAEAEFDRISQDIASSQQQITAQTREKIDSTRAASEAKIDSALSVYQSGEEERIRANAEASRQEVLDEVCLFDALSNSEETASVVSSKHVSKSATAAGNDRLVAMNDTYSLAGLNNYSSSLEIKIRNDVARAIKQLAAEKGMIVVFSRRDNNIPDKTQELGELMREQAWSVCRPVISESHGS